MKAIIFGASGAIGGGLIDILLQNRPTWEIYAVTRDIAKAKFAHNPSVFVLEGDPNNRDDVMRLTANKDIVYSCIGFTKYEARYWREHWPIVVDNLLAGSSQKPGQKFIFCDNLYAYGPGQDISPRSTTVPPSVKSKPGARAMLRAQLQARIDQDPSSISVVGAADFFGPGITKLSMLGDTFTKGIVNGKSRPLIFGSSSKIHDFCYAKDFSNALYIASIDRRADGKFWIAPHSIHNKTVQTIADDIAKIAVTGKVSVRVLPGWLVRMASPFDSFLKEMIEMMPFWTEDYTVDDSDFCKMFDVKPTTYENALKAHVEFYQSLRTKKV